MISSGLFEGWAEPSLEDDSGDDDVDLDYRLTAAVVQRRRAALRAAIEAVASSGPGVAPLTPDTLRVHGVTTELAQEALALEEQLLPMPSFLRSIIGLDGPSTRVDVVNLWEAIVDLLEGRSAIDVVRRSSGGVEVRWTRRRQLHEDWRAPTLVLDATGRERLLRPWWSEIETETIHAAAPHMRVHRILGSFSKAKLKSQRRLSELTRWIEVRAAECRRVGRTMGIVCNKSVEEALQPLPANVVTAHFNAVAGLNLMENVRYLAVIGRPLPPPSEVERLAQALSGSPVERIGDRWPEGDQHPDPWAEEMRQAIVVDQLIQSVGRGRGVRRRADHPLEVFILGDTPVPISEDTRRRWENCIPSVGDLLVARGIAPAAGPDAKGFARMIAALVPDSFSNDQAVKDAVRRGQDLTVAFPYKGASIGKCHRETRLPHPRYRVRLPHARYAVPLAVDPTLGEPIAAIRERLGSDVDVRPEPPPTLQVEEASAPRLAPSQLLPRMPRPKDQRATEGEHFRFAVPLPGASTRIPPPSHAGRLGPFGQSAFGRAASPASQARPRI